MMMKEGWGAMSIKITTVRVAHETRLEQDEQTHSIRVDTDAISSWVFYTVALARAFKKVTDVTTK
jgi:hypothetical protein